MKLLLLFIFLALSFALPVLTLFRYKSDKKIVLLFFGIMIYFFTTILVSFFSQAHNVIGSTSVSDRIAYVFILSLILSIVLFIMSKVTVKIFVKENAPAIYSGYAFINNFIYNMSSYGILFMVGFFHNSDRLEKMYGADYAKSLIVYYDNINITDLLALILELVISFYILYSLFCRFISSEKKIGDIVLFFVLTLLMYLIQFISPNMIIAFICYMAEALLVSGRIDLHRKKKS